MASSRASASHPVQTILITGVSSGVGKALAEQALRQGHTVIGTVRKQADRDAFEQQAHGRAHGRILDLSNTTSIPDAIADIVETLGPIDVLINNAGYGLVGPVEECTLDQIRAQFEVNVFAQLVVTQAVLPSMRERRSGLILNITSMGGLLTFPGVGVYNASKFAMEGFTDVLRKELAPFGIRVTAVEPGLFPTDWFGRSQQTATHTIPDYDTAWKAHAEFQPNFTGDLTRGAEAILSLLDIPNPPAHLPLDSTAVRLILEQLESIRAEIETNRALSESADTPSQ